MLHSTTKKYITYTKFGPVMCPGLQIVQYKATVSAPLVTTAWHVIMLFMDKGKGSPKPPDMEDSSIYCMLSKRSQTNDSCPPASGQSSGQQLKNVTHGLDKAMVKK